MAEDVFFLVRALISKIRIKSMISIPTSVPIVMILKIRICAVSLIYDVVGVVSESPGINGVDAIWISTVRS